MSTDYEITYCENHPTRETGLRCNRCSKYICASCAVKTPTGYRCQECIRQQSKIFDTAKSSDFVIAFMISGIMALIGSFIASFVGFFIYLIFLVGPAIGAGIANVIQRVVAKRRSKQLFQTVVIGIVLGGLLPTLLGLLFGAISFRAIWQLIYVGLAASTAYTRLAGIQLR